jgi:hypothetical protein
VNALADVVALTVVVAATSEVMEKKRWILREKIC